MHQIAHLHHITQETSQLTHFQTALNALKGGAEWIQLRVKNKPEQEVERIAREVKAICQEYGAKLILNDYLEMVEKIDADGVHLGLSDTSTQIARERLGKDKIIGGSCNTFEDVLYHAQNGVDYVGLGPFKFTSTKDKLSPVLGLEGYKEVLAEMKTQGLSLPLIAIGGIGLADVQALMGTGIWGIALASLVNVDADPPQKMREVLNLMNPSIEKRCL